MYIFVLLLDKQWSDEIGPLAHCIQNAFIATHMQKFVNEIEIDYKTE